MTPAPDGPSSAAGSDPVRTPGGSGSVGAR